MNNNENQNNNQGRGKGPGGFLQALMGITIAMVAASFIWSILFGAGTGGLFSSSNQEISYTEFLNKIENDEIRSVRIGREQIIAIGKSQAAINNETKSWTEEEINSFEDLINSTKANLPNVYRVNRVEDSELVNRILAKGNITIEGEESNSMIAEVISWILPFVLFMFIINMFAGRLGGGGMGSVFSIGKSQVKRYMQKETGITFKDVAGEDEAKESLVEIVDFLHNPSKYTYVGAKLPKGALLVGPPGTGKTLLAKAVAGEAKVPFFSMTGSDFVEMFAGVGASRVRDLFKQAKAAAPCIVFIDEIDAIGRSRDTRAGSGADSEREQTLNQLLSEMDGFEINNGIMVMAATNRPEILDQALLRPGRFDRRVVVEKPDLKGRVNILKVHAKDVKLDDTVDFEEIALSTSGAVGADLANMINEAAITAAKAKREKVCQKDLLDAVEVVLVGKEKKDRILSKEERKIVSYHEVGHALVTALLKHTEPVQKITIVPRTMGALGYVLQTPEEEKYLNTKKELEDKLVVFLSGRAAEDIVFDTITTGAANDIEQATKLARAMVTQYGMSDKFGLMGLATNHSMYLENGVDMNCGDETATQVDIEVQKMLREAFEKSKALLKQNRGALDKIAEYLIEKETITGKEFMDLFTEITGIKDEKKDRVIEKEDDNV